MTAPDDSVRHSVSIGPVEPDRTFSLRQRVLRPNERVEDMALLGSDHPDASVIAAVDDETGEVLSTAAVAPERPPDDLQAVIPAGRAWRLRSMATEPALRGSGLGSSVLALAVAHVATSGGGVLWCSARVPALGFYERAGFSVVGEVYDSPGIGPHQLMWRSVDPGGRS